MKRQEHPNGFGVRLLRTFKNGMRLRLHTWVPGVDRLKTPHDHRSWFISLPLWGRFLEQRYEEVRPFERRTFYSRPYQVLRCHQTSSNGRPITTPEGDSQLISVSSHTRYPLVPYFCGSGAIHSFVPIRPGFAASLVLFGAPKHIPRAFVPSEL